jgi:hypothetical protein
VQCPYDLEAFESRIEELKKKNPALYLAPTKVRKIFNPIEKKIVNFMEIFRELKNAYA